MVLWLAIVPTAYAANLTLSGQSNLTYADQTYDCLDITNCSHITVRHCSFKSIGTTGPVEITNSDSILIEDCDIDGDTNGCNGVNILDNSAYITIRDCDIHDVADDGFQVFSSHHIYLIGNTVRHLYGCGTDGGCGPCYNGHSDGIELYNSRNVEIHCNLVYDVRSTSGLIIGSWDETDCYDLNITNNIFYTPECNMVAYIFDVYRIKVFNNIFWQSTWQGLAIGRDTYDFELKNNILMNINYNHMLSGTRGMEYDSTEHDLDYNLLGMANQGCPKRPHDLLVPNHAFSKIPNVYSTTGYRDVTPADFMPLAANKTINAGCTGAGIPTTDFFGTPRDAQPDMGAIEYLPTESIEEGIKRAINSRQRGMVVEPNPFSAGTTIYFPANKPAVVTIYAASGRKVRILPPKQNAGPLVWDGTDSAGRQLPNGLYQVQVTGRDQVTMRPVVLMR
jgi:hypothetical protein